MEIDVRSQMELGRETWGFEENSRRKKRENRREHR